MEKICFCESDWQNPVTYLHHLHRKECLPWQPRLSFSNIPSTKEDEIEQRAQWQI